MPSQCKTKELTEKSHYHRMATTEISFNAQCFALTQKVPVNELRTSKCGHISYCWIFTGSEVLKNLYVTLCNYQLEKF